MGTPFSTSRTARIPERVGRYEVLLPIASGGMATVYLARTRRAGIDRDVALKLTHAHLRDTPEFATELLEEAKIAVRIRHPNVVPVLDVDDDPQGVFLVMQYVEGDTLGGLRRKATIESKPIPRPVSMRILLDALAGLHAAHELRDEEGLLMGVVHRDFSPQNILVGMDGIAKLTDFGIAKATSRHGHTRTGLVKGKISYMAPEQARGMSLDRRCDVWAAGVIAWEMLAQRRLYVADNDVGTLLKVVTEAPPPLSKVASTIAPEVERAVSHALTIDLDSRVGSALAFAKELEAACQSAGYMADHEEVAEYVVSLVGPHLAERRARAAEVVRLRGNLAEVIGPALSGDRSRDSVDSVSSSQVLGFNDLLSGDSHALPRHRDDDDDDDDSGQMATIVREPEFDSDEVAAVQPPAAPVEMAVERPPPPLAAPASSPSMSTGEVALTTGDLAISTETSVHTGEMDTRLRELPSASDDEEEDLLETEMRSFDDLVAMTSHRSDPPPAGADDREIDEALASLTPVSLTPVSPKPSPPAPAKPSNAVVPAGLAATPSRVPPLPPASPVSSASSAQVRSFPVASSSIGSSAVAPLSAAAASAASAPPSAVRAPTDPVAPAPFTSPSDVMRPTEPSLDLDTQVQAPMPNSVANASVVNDVDVNDSSSGTSDDGILVRLEGGPHVGPTVRVQRNARKSRAPWIAGAVAALVCAIAMSWMIHGLGHPSAGLSAGAAAAGVPTATNTAPPPSAAIAEPPVLSDSTTAPSVVPPVVPPPASPGVAVAETKMLAFRANAPIAAVRIDGRDPPVPAATKDVSIALLPEETTRTLKLVVTSADGRQATTLAPAGAAMVKIDFPPRRAVAGPNRGAAPPRPLQKDPPALAPSPYSR